MSEQTQREVWADTVSHLAARWAKADKRILRSVFPLLAEGQPVAPARIAEVTKSDLDAVESALKQGRAGRDREGRVVELSGLTLSPTMQRIEVGPVVLFSCCALLAHMVPLLLGREVTVESIDPVSRRIVRLELGAHEVIATAPDEAVATLAVTDPDAVLQDAGENFCRHTRHFAAAESAGDFVKANPCRYAVSVAEIHRAAKRLYQTAWADA